VAIVGYVPGQNGLGDRALVIDAGEAVHILYGHCERVHVNVGDHVEPGQHVADIGTRGYSDGCHVHFAVKQWGALSWTPPAGCLDPVPYMTNAGALPPSPPEEEDMTPDEHNALMATQQAVGELLRQRGPAALIWNGALQYYCTDEQGTVWQHWYGDGTWHRERVGDGALPHAPCSIVENYSPGSLHVFAPAPHGAAFQAWYDQGWNVLVLT
jgi:murein DD-endopeptidase MepM/ murein hydrolase activator NlpD